MIRTCQRISIVLGLSVAMVLGLAVSAGAAEASPAVVAVAPGTLTITNQVPYDHARIKISGPEGYALRQTAREMPVTIDLLNVRPLDMTTAAPEAGDEARLASLMDGRYSYSVVFYDQAGERVDGADGLFFVENGAAVSRDAIRSKFAEVREDLAAVAQPAEGADPATLAEFDWIAIVDGTDDGITYLSLDSDSPVANQYWEVVNNLGDLQIVEDTNFTPPGTVRMHFERGGNIGIATTTPGSPLEIGTTFPGIEMENAGANWRLSAFSDPGFGVRNQTTFAHPFVIHEDAPQNALRIRGSGVSMGISTAEASLHVQPASMDGNVLVRAATGGPHSLFAIENNAGAFFRITNATGQGGLGSWTFSSTGANNFVISSQGNPGSEFSMTPAGNLTIQGSFSSAGPIQQGSSRAIKDGIEAVDTAEILAKVAELPVATWKYKDDNLQGLHLGPMAEDFRQAFGLGPSDKTLAPADVAGVALAAIQALEAENRDLHSRLAVLEKLVLEQQKTAE